MNCQGSAYRPIVLTSMNDNSVEETLPGSTGNPSVSSYTALSFQTATFQTLQTLSHIRVAYANGVLTFNDTDGLISDAQFVNCGNGLTVVNSSGVMLENALLSNIPSYALTRPEALSTRSTALWPT